MMATKLKILVTGANGQLGMSIRKAAPDFPSFEIVYTDVEDLDITDPEAVKAYFSDNRFDVVINCAAYTAVDRAESEPEIAYRLNGEAVGKLAELSRLKGFLLVHFSTDYVFDGLKTTPYTEDDMPSPISKYAGSKYEGEKRIMASNANALIIRTSWLYSEFGHNFFKTIYNKCAKGEKLRVVFDQAGTPTYAGDLTKAILTILPKVLKKKGPEIFHYSNEGIASWYDFAACISRFSNNPTRITPILTHELNAPARRPAYSVMDKIRFKKEFGMDIPFWQESLINLLTDFKI